MPKGPRERGERVSIQFFVHPNHKKRLDEKWKDTHSNRTQLLRDLISLYLNGKIDAFLDNSNLEL